MNGVIKRKEELKASDVPKCVNTKITWLIDRNDGAERYEMRKFWMGPGGSMPKHLHPDIEHEQYILSGKMKITLGDEVYEVKEGDAVLIPAGVPHAYANPYDEPVEFICVIPKVESYETKYL